jgi:uncharacterized membrane protein YqhA
MMNWLLVQNLGAPQRCDGAPEAQRLGAVPLVLAAMVSAAVHLLALLLGLVTAVGELAVLAGLAAVLVLGMVAALAMVLMVLVLAMLGMSGMRVGWSRLGSRGSGDDERECADEHFHE